jgi:signal transduction histidine kinase/DNA-binding response OmpR family regulator
MSVVTVISLSLFALLFVTTLVAYVRRRDALARDVMLIFASVAALFAVFGASVLGVRLPNAVNVAALVLLLAQPLFSLRLANQVNPVPRWVRYAAVIGFVLSTTPMLVVPLRGIALFFLPAIAVFCLTHLVAAYALMREAGQRVGSARTRLRSAAAAGAVMALALGLTAFGSISPILSQAAQVLSLGAATLYALAFMPPRFVKKVWSAVSTYEFTHELIGDDTRDSSGLVWKRATEMARRTSGARAAAVVSGHPVRVLAADVAQGVDARGLAFTALPEGGAAQRLTVEGTEIDRIARGLGARYVTVLRFGGSDNEAGAMVLFRALPSLFAADDLLIIGSLVERAVVFAQRSDALEQHAAMADRLALTVQALERASQAKSDFLASMSHELRTPLSAIIGFSSLMSDEPVDGDRRRIPDEWIQHVHRSGEHLLSLINDVLDLTKIEAGRIELERETFDLGAALAESVEGLRPLADRKRLAVAVEVEPGSVVADRGRLRQIVYNLLSNAIKFTPDGGRIVVRATWQGNDAKIAVTDTGVGIAADDLEHVFEEFRQVGDLKAREAGTGLGLALSRRLAEAHGGALTVASELGVGSRFELTLPGSRGVDETRAAPPVAAPMAEPAAVGSGTSVLVIEDDPGAVRLLRTYLEGEGYEVVVAADGEAGIAAARANAPAAIILDVLLPGIDGWEVLRRLKTDATLRDVPVVVATVVDERNVAMGLGAADYFLKPIRPEALLARLAQYTFTTKVKQRRVKVLAVDDDPSARELVVEALRPAGFDIAVAASGREALELARDDPPELVICDLVMPDVDGYEVVDQLRSNPATQDATILILTGHDLTDSDRARLNGKVAEVLAKDADPRPALAKWLQRAAAAAQRRRVLLAEG